MVRESGWCRREGEGGVGREDVGVVGGDGEGRRM